MTAFHPLSPVAPAQQDHLSPTASLFSSYENETESDLFGDHNILDEPHGSNRNAYLEREFIIALENSFRMYKKHGARSTEKLKPIHKYIAHVLQRIWGREFKIHYLGDDSGEMKVAGKYYPKDIDITVTHKGEPIFCLGIKFVTSNYKQNSNNYFEGMMGETANIQAVGNLPYAQLIILRHRTPYYKKNETETPSKIEIIEDRDMLKYLKLTFDISQAHRPEYLGIQIVSINETNNKISPTNLEETFSIKIAGLLRGKLSLTSFFNEISQYKNFYTAK